jgi:hypothetical protein
MFDDRALVSEAPPIRYGTSNGCFARCVFVKLRVTESDLMVQFATVLTDSCHWLGLSRAMSGKFAHERYLCRGPRAAPV